MSQEFRAIVGFGISIATLVVGLGALMVTAQAGVNDRLDSMQTRLDSMQTQLGSMQDRLDSMQDRLDSMQDRLGSMQVELSAIGQRVAYIEGRLDNQASQEERP